MALVAYDNSDSEFEEDDDDNTTAVIINKQGQSKPLEQTAQTSEANEGPNLFNLLPQPSKKKPEVIEEDDEFLHKKEAPVNIVKPKAKITVPSLCDFKDVSGTVVNAKTKVQNGKKSGLLSMLPQPKHNLIKTTTKSLIPHVLTQKPSTSNVKKKQTLPTPMKKAKTSEKTLPLDYSDESGDEEVDNDFFSFNKPVELPVVENLPLEPEIPAQAPVKNVMNKTEKRDIQSYFKQDRVEDEVQMEQDYSQPSSSIESYDSGYYHSNGHAQESSQNNVELDEEAIMKLCGTRGKRKREEIQIVDVNQQEVLAEARQWLMKGLMDDTTKRVSASKKKGNEPTNQQKRKHQITYLAHQAKANEAELQNQWANNRMSKRQTQSKYGF